MTKSQYPEPTEDVVKNLLEIFDYRGEKEIGKLIESAQATFEETGYDNWNGGTTTWELRLFVPTTIYAANSNHLPKIENLIKEKLNYLDRLHANDPIGGVVIAPSKNLTASARKAGPSDAQVKHIWGEGPFHLFLSHLSRDKVVATQLREELVKLGVATFVAHEDIEPTRKWQGEIELALRSMHALAALITPEFHNSRWTNQEIGWALGRGIPVFSIRMGADPSGFIGSEQAISGNPSNIPATASKIAQVLIDHAATQSQMRRGMINAFCKSGSFKEAKELCDHIINFTDFTEKEKEILWIACDSNDQVSGSFGVRGKIYALIGRPPPPKVVEADSDIPF